MTSYEAAATDLLARERAHLRAANRALRDTREAMFFGDEDQAFDYLQEAEEQHYAAEMCAQEAWSLMGESSDSSRTTGPAGTGEGVRP